MIALSDITSEHIVLCALLIVWCTIHSAMISQYGLALGHRVLRTRFRYYRLLYNIIAVLTLLPLLAFWSSLPAKTYFDWFGSFRLVQVLLLGSGIFLLYAGGKSYDGLDFMGIRQILSKGQDGEQSKTGELRMEGILRITRHPWYLAGLFLLWGREIDSVSLVVNIVFSIYLVVGAWIEEKKLVREFGEAYKKYQSRVSMFLPFKWIVARLK